MAIEKLFLLPGRYPSIAPSLIGQGRDLEVLTGFFTEPSASAALALLSKAASGADIALIVPPARHYSLSLRKQAPGAIVGEVLSRAMRLIEVMVRHEEATGVNVRVVFLSSAQIYDQAEIFPTLEIDTAMMPMPLDPVGLGFLAAERLLVMSCIGPGLWPIILRPVSVMDPLDYAQFSRSSSITLSDPFPSTSPLWVDLLSRVSTLGPTGRIPILGSGVEFRDLVHVNDLISAITLAIDSGPRMAAYNVSSGHGASVHDFVQELSEVMFGCSVDLINRGDHPYESAKIIAPSCEAIGIDLDWRPGYDRRSILTEMTKLARPDMV